MYILTWWNLGYYYIAYPLIILAALAVFLVIKQLVTQHEFLYRRFWVKFCSFGCLLIIISYVVSIFCYHLPTP